MLIKYVLLIPLYFLSITYATKESCRVQDPCWTQDALFLKGDQPTSQSKLLINLIQVLGRHPHWFKLLPHIIKNLRGKAEKEAKLCFTPQEGELIKKFFYRHCPETASGWILYAKFLTSQGKENFANKLRHFWITASLSKEEQASLLKTFPSMLKSAVRLQRIARLLWDNEIELAKHLLEITKLPPQHGLWVAARLLTKNACVNDPKVLQDFDKLPKAYQKWDLLQAAKIRFLIRAGQPEQAWTTWLNAGLTTLREDTTSGGTVRKTAKTSVDKLEIGVKRELWQEGNRLNAQGDTKKAAFYYQHILRSSKERIPTLWDEEVWLEGLTSLIGLKDPKKALGRFLVLAECPHIREEALADFPFNLGKSKHSAQTIKCLKFPARTEPRYRSRGYFWAGICYEQLGQSAKAKACYEKASTYGFYFYGQLAQYKLGKPLTMVFAQANSQKGLKTNRQKELDAIACTWHRYRTGSAGSTYVNALLEDLFNACQTPHDARRMLDLAALLSPISKTFLAKRLTADPKTIFPEAYPICSLPVKAQDPALIYAIILAETCFNPEVISSAGARGMMQIMPYEAESLAKKAGIPYDPSKLLDANYSMRLGITEIQDKLREHRLYIPAIAAYNAGSKKSKEWQAKTPKWDNFELALAWIESIPYAETRAYVPRVLEHRAIYRFLAKSPILPSEILDLLCGQGKMQVER